LFCSVALGRPWARSVLRANSVCEHELERFVHNQRLLMKVTPRNLMVVSLFKSGTCEGGWYSCAYIFILENNFRSAIALQLQTVRASPGFNV
jgi:hypothetical protein